MDTLKQFSGDNIFRANELIQAYYHDEHYNFTPIHTHDFHELNIVMTGNGKHYLNDSAYSISSGDVFIMPPGVPHGYEFDSKKYSIFHLLFSKKFFEKYQEQLECLTGYEILFNIDPLIRSQNENINNFLHVNITENYNLMRIFDELTLLENTHKNNTENAKEYLALYVISKICEMIEDEKATYSGNKRYSFDLLKSIEYIHLNYGNKIDLQDLYEISCMSRSSYIRYFKQIFNCTPIEYIQNYRLRQSKSMLKHTDKSLAVIANDCGFCDSAHFSRLFKEKYQLSPSKYRSSLRDSAVQSSGGF